MEQSEKLYYKNLLIKEKDDILATLNKMEEHGIGSPDEYSSGELSSYDNHPAELGTEVYNLGMNLNLKVHEQYQLREINQAMEKLDNGKYGICEYCGKHIDNERIEIRPQARLCIDCEKSRETNTKELINERPVEEDVLMTPENQGYPDANDDLEFEGMDQWNDLEKYGSSSTPQDLTGSYKDYKEFYTNEVDKQGIVDPMDNISNEEYEKQL